MKEVWVIILLIFPYDGDPYKVETLNHYQTKNECQEAAYSNWLQQSMVREYKDKGVIQVVPGCELQKIEVGI